ncbi:hypothetical protein BD413DRAFT_472400 [Trametes elegans]|nr:hypothetical protein BD413DRAFT_472400 [Trametes elegans]
MLILAATLVPLSTAHSARAFHTPSIPLNWTTISPCAVDNPARILAADVTTQTANNTPAACVAACAARGFGYAGVEFANECHCGTGLVGALQPAPASDCDMACAGDPNVACGGPWRIQVYGFPALRPGSWVYQGCVVDGPGAPALPGASVLAFAPATLDLVDQCLQACARGGFAFAGVENGATCQCSESGPGAAAQKADEADCSSLCPLPGDAGFEFCGGVERLGVYKLVG